jgi:hypothetical protein
MIDRCCALSHSISPCTLHVASSGLGGRRPRSLRGNRQTRRPRVAARAIGSLNQEEKSSTIVGPSPPRDIPRLLGAWGCRAVCAPIIIAAPREPLGLWVELGRMQNDQKAETGIVFPLELPQSAQASVSFASGGAVLPPSYMDTPQSQDVQK